MENFKSGFAALIGRPNVGKSTIMNMLVGEKIAIVSKKPQTTRNKILSIVTRDNCQIVFLDTPGLHTPKTKLGEIMVKSAETASKDVDVILFITEPTKKVLKGDADIIEKLNPKGPPVFLIINKIDTCEKADVLDVIEAYRRLYDFKEIIPISALKMENTDDLISLIVKYLPEGPKYFPDDMVTDQPERQIVAEMIREKALMLLNEEVPHGIAVEITAMKKRDDSEIVDIDANINCEKDSHKGIIIGKNGEKLKSIGTKARADIEMLLDSPVYLRLWVKVKKDWRDNNYLLRTFGFNGKE